jgi:tRNA modification GTPase
MVLEALLASGARMADPGEFTLRSFLNNKLDLAQAEAVADVIHASSTAAHRVSMSQLEGHYSKILEDLRIELVDLGAMLELELDFSEEDVEFADRDRLYSLLRNAKALLSELVDSYRTGSRIRDGVKVIIAGKPNAGKSTLLNALVGKNRSIVSSIPGTTRDEIESEIEIDGLSFKFLDTAGLRETSDVIEKEGVRRTLESMASADIILAVYDSTEEFNPNDVADIQHSAAEGATTVLVANKSDLGSIASPGNVPRMISISALRALTHVEELTPLIDVLKEIATKDLGMQDASRIVTNLRHKDHLAKANDAVHKCIEALDSGASGDLVSIELRHALSELGSITGEITNEDILDSIFSRFCIGK